MTIVASSVRIALGSVVLDRPDRTGQYIAKDLAGGWAYLIADQEGDNRYRGQGACAGGLEIGLRCAFLSAAGCIENSRRITVYVETPQAHRAMVLLATSDPRTIEAIGGRQLSIMTRPNDRSSYHVRSAAERAATAALFERERREWETTASEAEADATETPVTTIEAGPVAPVLSLMHQTWRSRVGAADARGEGGPSHAVPATPADPGPIAAPCVRPAPEAAPARPPAPRNRALTEWLSAFDSQVADLATDLRDAGT